MKNCLLSLRPGDMVILRAMVPFRERIVHVTGYPEDIPLAGCVKVLGYGEYEDEHQIALFYSGDSRNKSIVKKEIALGGAAWYMG